VADRPLRPATDRRLGKLLPHQLANRPQALPMALLRALFLAKRMRYCQRFLAGIPHLGVGTHVLLTRPPLTRIAPCAFDLHVLGTPPAFILSQDQTRHPIYMQIPLKRFTFLVNDKLIKVFFQLLCRKILYQTSTISCTCLPWIDWLFLLCPYHSSVVQVRT
jgi:hypothetical protein